MIQLDVARLAGVSQSTVSRTLKNDSRISSDVRKRVLDAAESLGYRPDVAVQALINRRWLKTGFRGLNIACIAGESSRETWRKGLAAAAARNGLVLSEYPVGKETNVKQLGRGLRNCGIRGVVVDCVDGSVLQNLDLSNYGVIQVGTRLPPIRFHWVGHDLYAITRDFLEGAITRGYRRVGCVFVNSWVRWDDDMRIAAVEGVRVRHPELKLPPILWIKVDNCFEENRRLIKNYVQKWGVDGLIGFNTYLLSVLKSLNIAVPDEIAVGLLHMDGDPAKYPVVALPFMDEVRIANMAIHLLHGMLRDNERGIPEEAMNIVLRTHKLDWGGFPVRQSAKEREGRKR